jgi:hypothetical protein
LVTELAEDYGVGIEWLCPWNDTTGLTFSELLPIKTTQNDYKKKGWCWMLYKAYLFREFSNAGLFMEQTSSRSRRWFARFS